MEPDLAWPHQHVALVEKLFAGIVVPRPLIHDGFVKPDFSLADARDQVAASADFKGAPTAHAQPDAGWIAAGTDHEIELELPLVPVERHGHVRQDVAVEHAGIVRNIPVPPGGVAAQEVIACAGQLIHPRYPGCRGRARTSHPESRS